MTTADRAREILATYYECAMPEISDAEVKTAVIVIEALSQGQQGREAVAVGEVIGYGRVTGEAHVKLQNGLPPGCKLYTAPPAPSDAAHFVQLIRKVASDPGTIMQHGSGFVQGMRRAANLIAERAERRAREHAAAIASRPVVDDGIPQPTQECYSNDDGDHWLDSPDDAEFIDGLGLGDTYELCVSHYWVRRIYRVTKVPDEHNDDYEVEPVALIDSAQEEDKG